MQRAAQEGNAEIVRYLVEIGEDDIDSPACGDFGRTALQYASEKGHVEVVEYLLGRGADINAAPYHYGGVTALQAAAISGRARIVLALLDAGADVTAPGARCDGRTAIEGAAEHGRLEILHIFLQVHPRGQGLDEQLRRAEELAESEDHGEVLRAIREYRESV